MAVASEQPSTYRAAVMHQFREPPTIDPVAARELAPGQVRAGRTRLIREVRPLDAVNESMADVEAGKVAARVVFVL